VSDSESLAGQDFSTFSPDQLDEVFRLTVQIASRLARKLSRRRRPVARRGPIDLRRTLRANLNRGDLIDLRYRRRKRRKVRLLLLCDVSGSMDLYSRFLLQFVFALQSVFNRVETFTFATRLTRVTQYLKARSYREALRRLTEVRDWSGGTRIGESLATFNREWPYLVDRRTIVIVLSDGWDTGEPELLASCYRRSIEVAAENSIRTLAFPGISTGVYGYPKAPAARIAVTTVRAAVPAFPLIREVIFCCHSAADLAVYQALLAGAAS
jgi:uncharacterized protein with von Willebrand factor type A (vWA) domain